MGGLSVTLTNLAIVMKWTTDCSINIFTILANHHYRAVTTWNPFVLLKHSESLTDFKSLLKLMKTVYSFCKMLVKQMSVCKAVVKSCISI